MPAPIHFAAYCERCDWTGRTRADNLVAMRDFDEHLLTRDHLMGVSNRPPEPGDIIFVDAADEADRREIEIVSLFDGDGGSGSFEVIDINDDAWGVIRDNTRDTAERRAWVAQ